MIIYQQRSLRSRLARIHKRLLHIVWPRLTARRAWNLAVCEAQKRLRSPRVAGRPYVLFMEICSLCQLDCPGCLSAQPGRHRRMMPLPEFQRLLDRFAPWLLDLELYGWGEPFLNRDIFGMIRHAKTRNLFVRTSTNGNAFQPGDAARLVESGLDQLNVSLDGATQETYAAYRVGARLDVALEAVRQILDARRQAGARMPLVEWQMIVSRRNEHEVEAVKRLAEETGVDILRLDLPFSLQHIDDAEDPKAVDRWLAASPPYRLWAEAHGEGGSAFPCHCGYLWTTMQVDALGQANPCPNRLGSQLQWGDPLRNDIRDLWNRPEFVQARRLFGREAVACPAPGHPCAGCKEFRQPWKIPPLPRG